MRAFLEQYGIAIFVLVIIGIMTLMSSSLGHTIEGLVTQEVKRFTDKSNSENTKVINNKKNNKEEVGEANPTELKINFNKDEVYSKNREVLLTYDKSKETEEEFINRVSIGSAWDYDINYYKLSNQPLNSSNTYYVKNIINNKTYEGVLTPVTDIPGVSNGNDKVVAYYLLNAGGEGFSMPYIISTEEDYTYEYQGTGKFVDLTKGVWFIDLVGSTISSSDYLEFSTIKLNMDSKVFNGVFDNMECIKISNSTYSSPEELIGKTASYTITLGSDTESETFTITDADIEVIGDKFTLIDFLLVTEDGIYLPVLLMTYFDTINIEIK